MELVNGKPSQRMLSAAEIDACITEAGLHAPGGGAPEGR